MTKQTENAQDFGEFDIERNNKERKEQRVKGVREQKAWNEKRTKWKGEK